MSDARSRTTEYYEGTVEAVYQATSGAILHLGIFIGDEPRRTATNRTKAFLASQLDFSDTTSVLDLGSGYGDAARYLAGRFGCPILCANLIHSQNRKAAAINIEENLEPKIKVVTADFAALPFQGGWADVVWSQEAFLHATDRAAVMQASAQMLSSGGQLIFTDLLQIDAMSQSQAHKIFDRVKIDSLESFESYMGLIQSAGLEIEQVVDLSAHVSPSYRDHLQSLHDRHQQLSGMIGRPALEETIAGMEAWVNAAEEKKLGWGMFRACKP